jgi:DNA-3-methyladenine glycosylase II
MVIRGRWHHARVAYSRARMQAAADHIVAADPTFTSIVGASPLCTIGKGARTQLSPFHSLVGSVIAQQLSVKAADTITARVQDNLGEVTPKRIVEVDESDLRAAGLSGAKTRTIKGLAHAVHDGALDLEKALTHPEDSAIVAELTKLWGIGRWTAEMFLMFTMHRLDVWPTGDLAMRKGWNIVHGASGDINPQVIEPLGDPLRPYRSVAAWYCWRAVEGGASSW